MSTATKLPCSFLVGLVTKQASVTMGVKTTGGVNVVTENAVTIVSMTPVMRRMDDVNLDVRVATGESCVPSVCFADMLR